MKLMCTVCTMYLQNDVPMWYLLASICIICSGLWVSGTRCMLYMSVPFSLSSPVNIPSLWHSHICPPVTGNVRTHTTIVTWHVTWYSPWASDCSSEKSSYVHILITNSQQHWGNNFCVSKTFGRWNSEGGLCLDCLVSWYHSCHNWI